MPGKDKVQTKDSEPIPQPTIGRSKKAVVLLADLFQDAEAIYPFYRLREADVTVEYAGAQTKDYVGKWGYHLKATMEIAQLNANNLDLVVIPGGWAPEKLRQDPAVLGLLREMDRRGKVIAAICHAGWVLASSGIAKGRRVTCYEGISEDLINAGAKYIDRPVVADENLITSRRPDDLPDFMRAVIERLGR